ncbi:IseA DL-endopeptidase inhibitor family protein [Paenibacillus caui]|uniref:IseA DL-endopeptidase inhibitor family protein n=1 Tax=Paenibacillus caui TaxID=2873927 RepID=UPI001CA87E99|nr:IseA DL-endopeptidase inhibitor family protein [Paenibacillus caui]
MKINSKLLSALAAAMIGITALGATAGAAAAGTSAPSGDKAAVAPSAKQPETETVKVTDPTAITRLNHTSVPPLMAEAGKRYLYALSGGNGAKETFELNGKTYRYLSEDIGTRSKLLEYLKKSYTNQAAEYFINKFFIVHNGLMAQLDADGSYILDLGKTTAKMLSMTSTQRVYKLSVPDPEHKQGPKYIIVKFEKVDDYWRVGTAPHAIF